MPPRSGRGKRKMMASDQPPPPTHYNYVQPNTGPLKIANAAAAPSDKQSTGYRTPVQLACLSQRALSYEHLFFSFFFTVRSALWVPVPPSTKLTPRPTYTMSPASHTFRSRQLKLWSKPAAKSVQNCRSPKPNAIALLLSTHPQRTRVEDIDGRVGSGGRLAAVGVNHVKF